MELARERAKTIAQIASDLGSPSRVPRLWTDIADVDEGGPRLVELRRTLRVAEMEVEIP